MVQRLAEMGPTDVVVTSAGTSGTSSVPPTPLLREGAAFGLQVADHVPTRVTPEALAAADLVVCMALEHVRELVVLHPAAFAKTFTLREIVRRGTAAGPRHPGEALGEYLLRLHAGRRHMDLIGTSPQDDTPDPMGGQSEDFRRMLEEIDVLTRRLYDLLWPPSEQRLSASA